MASLRKASAYSKKKTRPYTRKSKKRQQAYIKAVPPMKIVKFTMGNMKSANEGKFPYVVKLVSEERVLVRDNALESCRMLVSKLLDRFASGQYSFSIKVYPHHILRENKSAGGMAGADRISTGMTHSFGVTIGRAAIVNPGKELFTVMCETDKVARLARKILSQVKPKVPGRTKVIFEMKS